MYVVVTAICEIYKVTRHKTASYNPCANGCVGGQNALICQILKIYVNQFQNNWYQLQSTVLKAMKSTPNTETSCYTSFKILFGSKMRLPFGKNLFPQETLGPEAKQHEEQLI